MRRRMFENAPRTFSINVGNYTCCLVGLADVIPNSFEKIFDKMLKWKAGYTKDSPGNTWFTS